MFFISEVSRLDGLNGTRGDRELRLEICFFVRDAWMGENGGYLSWNRSFYTLTQGIFRSKRRLMPRFFILRNSLVLIQQEWRSFKKYIEKKTLECKEDHRESESNWFGIGKRRLPSRLVEESKLFHSSLSESSSWKLFDPDSS